jgi:regulatory protein
MVNHQTSMSAERAFEKLAALCARSEHCQHDLTEKMRQWGVSAEEQAQVMERLTAGRYVDDARYARAFVQDKVKYNKWGRRKVEQALWAKHIDEATAQEALDAISDSDYVDMLRPMLRQKAKSTSAKSLGEQRAKLVKWALGRGFTMNIILQCIDVDDEDEYLD